MGSGASESEIALVAFLVVVVLLATKIGKIGEAIGGLFERGDGAAAHDPTGAHAGGAPAEATAEDLKERKES